MLSNITVNGVTPKLGGNIADGQWTYKTVTVASGTWNESNRRYNFSVSNYLPDNTYTYEVLIGCYAGTDSTAGHTSAWWVHNSDGQLQLVMGYCRTRTSSNVTSANSGIFATKQVDGILTFSISGSSTGSSGLYLWGYRRVGTIDTNKTYYTLKVNPTPSDATVSFSGGTIVDTNTCKVLAGHSVTYYVTRSGYTAQNASVTMDSNKEINVTLTIPYTPNQVLYESSTGGASTTLTLEVDGRYQVICVGGGSGGAYVYSSKFSDGRASGGSGAGFNGFVNLSSGSHTIKIGAGGSGQAYEKNGQVWATSKAGGQSAIDSIIVAGGGGAAKAGIHGATQTAGSGGILSYDSSKVQSYSLATNGNAGTTTYNSNITGGASVYGGYGKGGNAGNSYTTAGSNGYVKVVYIGV